MVLFKGNILLHSGAGIATDCKETGSISERAKEFLSSPKHVDQYCSYPMGNRE
jgi:hypothetical protein